MYNKNISAESYIDAFLGKDSRKKALLNEILSYIPKGKDHLEFDTKYKSVFSIYHRKYERQGKLYAICNNCVMVRIPNKHNDRVAYMTYIPFNKMDKTTMLHVLIDLIHYLEWKNK
jgi:hypothetical protein